MTKQQMIALNDFQFRNDYYQQQERDANIKKFKAVLKKKDATQKEKDNAEVELYRNLYTANKKYNNMYKELQETKYNSNGDVISRPKTYTPARVLGIDARMHPWILDVEMWLKWIFWLVVITTILFIILFFCTTAFNWALSTGPWTSRSTNGTQTYWEFLVTMFTS